MPCHQSVWRQVMCMPRTFACSAHAFTWLSCSKRKQYATRQSSCPMVLCVTASLPQDGCKIDDKIAAASWHAQPSPALSMSRSLEGTCRLRGWFQARNPGLTAAEVLTSPFFKPCYEQNWAEGVRNGPSQLRELSEIEQWEM